VGVWLLCDVNRIVLVFGVLILVRVRLSVGIVWVCCCCVFDLGFV